MKGARVSEKEKMIQTEAALRDETIQCKKEDEWKV